MKTQSRGRKTKTKTLTTVKSRQSCISDAIVPPAGRSWKWCLLESKSFPLIGHKKGVLRFEQKSPKWKEYMHIASMYFFLHNHEREWEDGIGQHWVMHKESQNPSQVGLALASLHHYVVLLKALKLQLLTCKMKIMVITHSFTAEGCCKNGWHTRKSTLNAMALSKMSMNVRVRMGGTLWLTIKLTFCRVIKRHARPETLDLVAVGANVPGSHWGLATFDTVSVAQTLQHSKTRVYA